MKNPLRKIAGVRLGIAIQVFTTLLILAVGLFAIEGNLGKLAKERRPISPYQLKMAMLDMRARVLLIAAVAFVSGLAVTFTISRDLKRAVRNMRDLSRGMIEPRLPGDLSQEFVPLNSAIRDLGESLNRFLQNSLTDAIILLDEDGCIDALNPAGEMLLGYRQEELSGRPLDVVFPEDPSNRDLHGWLGAKGADSSVGDPRMGTLVNQKGEWIPVRLTTFHIRRADRTYRGILAGVFDRAEWERIREEFDRADRMSTLGMLVSGLAHEVRNPLGSIQGLVDMLREEVPEGHPRRRYYDTIREEVDRLNGIMERLLETASPSRWVFSEVSLWEIVEDVIALMRPEARERGIDLLAERGDGIDRVRADPDRIHQAVVNVVKNALEATPRGKCVECTLSTEGPWTVLSVKNPGGHIPQRLAERLPTPFLTTKAHGTGLGLAITHQILFIHDGHLQIRNLESGGVLVRLLLPQAKPQAGRGEDRELQALGGRGGPAAPARS